jgi:peptide methionine sulfoxide reductase msrA/msrB
MLRWIDVIKFARYGNPEPERRVEKSDEEWKQALSPEQYFIARQKGTERPYTGAYCKSYEPGQYACICCGSLLFDSHEKFNSLSGWPSFTQPMNKAAIKYVVDNSHGMKRVEVLCNVCDGHLGHVFPDGPEPGGLRYCVNSESIKRIDEKKALATLGGGCFWCIEAIMQQLKGVEEVESGYSGGKIMNPTYKEVSSAKTGHAEVVRVKFDPDVISYRELLEVFFAMHNPTLIDPADSTHPQYRSVIFYYNEQQKEEAENLISELQPRLEKPVLTQALPFRAFFKAEDHHQNYYQSDPQKGYCQNIIAPKLRYLKELYKNKLKSSTP